MLALYIILGVLLFLFLLTLLNIWVYFDYDNKPALSARIAFVRLQLVPPKPQKPKKKKKKPKPAATDKPKEKKPAEKKSAVDLKKLLKEKGVSGILNIVKRIAELAVGTLGDLFSKVVVNRLDITVDIAGSDAADAAVKYGRVCAVFYPALNIILNVFKVKKRNINLSPDFTDGAKSRAKAKVVARVRVISLICVAIKRGIQALKLYMKLR